MAPSASRKSSHCSGSLSEQLSGRSGEWQHSEVALVSASLRLSSSESSREGGLCSMLREKRDSAFMVNATELELDSRRLSFFFAVAL